MSSGLGKAGLGKAAPHVALGTQGQTQGIQGPPACQSVHLSVHSACEAEWQELEGKDEKAGSQAEDGAAGTGPGSVPGRPR